MGWAGNPNTERLNQSAEVERRRLPLHGKVGGNNDFIYLFIAQTFQQVADMQLVRANTIQRRECTVEYMIATTIRAASLDRHQTLRFFDNTDDLAITPRITAQGARVGLSYMMTD